MCAFTIRYCAQFNFSILFFSPWSVCRFCVGDLLLLWRDSLSRSLMVSLPYRPDLPFIAVASPRSGVWAFHLGKYGSDIFPNRRPTLTYSMIHAASHTLVSLSYSYSHFHPEIFHISIFNVDYLFHYCSDRASDLNKPLTIRMKLFWGKSALASQAHWKN